MKDKGVSMKVPVVFKRTIKRATVNHAYAKKLEEPMSQNDMLLRLDRFLKLYPLYYNKLINMEDIKC